MHCSVCPAEQLDELVWTDLCRILTDPTCITHELERAHVGEWLSQALQARRQTLQKSITQLDRQQARLLEVYLAEVIAQDEFEHKRFELAQTQQGLERQLHQEEAAACGDRAFVRWSYQWTDAQGNVDHIRGVDIFQVRDGKVAEKLAYVKG